YRRGRGLCWVSSTAVVAALSFARGGFERAAVGHVCSGSLLFSQPSRYGETSRQRRELRAAVKRAAGGSSDKFDKAAFLRREEFDPLSLQSYRQEALLQYSNTNQSEPLRIYIFLFLTISGLCSPAFAARDVAAWYYIIAAVLTLGSGFLFLRERGKRTAQLVRLQREYSLGDLKIEISDSAVGTSTRCEVRSLRTKRRVVALFGKRDQLAEALAAALPYRRRLEQSGVVIIPISASNADDAEAALAEALGGASGVRAAARWLATPLSLESWRQYFEDLLEEKGGTNGRAVWVGLSVKGRVFGSDFGCPVWDELLAAMPPLAPPRSTEPAFAGADSQDLLAAQASFYTALTGGDEAALAKLFTDTDDLEISEALRVDAERGFSNLSGWEMVLAPGARPELTVASQDAVLLSQTHAVSTCIEFPVLGPTLLASQ
ncbi:unnamed protein product, partial [Polarella glacialis]